MSENNGIPVWRHVGATPCPAAPCEALQTLIVGAGPVGLTLALDLARRGHKVTVLNRLDFVAAGSKAICFSKRTLDIWGRLGVSAAMIAAGVSWKFGKVYWGASPDPVYQFDMEPVKHQQMPGFINLQQYLAEDILLAALDCYPNVAIRWGHHVVGVVAGNDGARVDVRTADGAYAIDCEWLIACDGSRSSVRTMLGLAFEGQVFEDNFLIADVRMHGDLPSERRFWFDPPFNPGRSALLHKQPGDVWRLDFQLGPGIDKQEAARPDNVEPYVRALLGPEAEFSREWYSVYSFQCRRMARFLHGRVIFAGDSAHLVSPFGARGCNGGVADADNLGWKLDLVLRGEAPERLLESYDHEAVMAADENILQSTRSTDFLTPRTAMSRRFRDGILQLAATFPFARPFVNSGRLSTAISYPASPLNTPDVAEDDWRDGIPPGSPALDAPLADGWLLDRLGNRFALLAWGPLPEPPPTDLNLIDLDGLPDRDGLLARRYGLEPGSAYLVRPDQYIAARWRSPDAGAIAQAIARERNALMPKLVTDTNLRCHDEIFQRLVTSLDGMDDEESLQAIVRLVLILANHIGDEDILYEAIAAAMPPGQGAT